MQKIPIERIAPNPDQPRKKFDAAELDQLAASIKAEGLLQPITVRPIGKGRYEIVAGERRWRAHKLLADRGDPEGKMIACHVRAMNELARDIAAIIENLQRSDITPLEEADAYLRLQKSGLTPEQIAARTGAGLMRVKWRLSLRNLEPNIKRLFESEQIDRQAALEIARLPDHRDQVRILGLVNRGQLVGWKAVRTAVDALVTGETQADIFGPQAPPASQEELRVLSVMEARIEKAAALVSTGWKDGECVIANRVNPDRARLVADKLRAIQTCLRIMERELRNVSAQAIISDQ